MNVKTVRSINAHFLAKCVEFLPIFLNSLGKHKFERRAVLGIFLILFYGNDLHSLAQNSPGPPIAPVIQNQMPFPTQLKKTVVFVQANCLKEPSLDELSKMTLKEQAKWKPEVLANTSLDDLRKLPANPYSGTGFIVSVPDDRLGKNHVFTYLITNRHVAQPGSESGKPCRVTDYILLLNRKGKSPNASLTLGRVPIALNDWTYPKDESVDLAAVQFVAPVEEWDYKMIPTNVFATQKMIDQGTIVEGEPVLFSGLFIQYEGQGRVEPVVRSGTIAMLSDELITTTLNKPGHVFLTDAHVFGGNSGSPMMVDTTKFTNEVGYDYKLLGVVSGEVFETKELTLQTTTSFNLQDTANSGVSMVVPAPEVLKLLMQPELVKERDTQVLAAQVKR